jgi:hypothetical protein
LKNPFITLPQNKIGSKFSPPLAGGDEGEWVKEFLFTPTFFLPRQGGGGLEKNIIKMADTRVGGIGH